MINSHWAAGLIRLGTPKPRLPDHRGEHHRPVRLSHRRVAAVQERCRVHRHERSARRTRSRRNTAAVWAVVFAICLGVGAFNAHEFPAAGYLWAVLLGPLALGLLGSLTIATGLVGRQA